MPFLGRIRTIATGVAGSPWYTNFYFRSVPGSDTPQNWADAVIDYWNVLDGLTSNGVTFAVQPDVAVIDEATGQQTSAYQVTGANIVSIGGTEPLPAATQGLVRWETQTFVSGRRLRGRSFMPWVPESFSSNGVPDTSYRNVLDGAAEALIADADSELRIYSPTGATSGLVTSASVWTKWAVLRSRRD